MRALKLFQLHSLWAISRHSIERQRRITGRFWQETFGWSRKHPQRPLSLLLLPRYPELSLRLAVVQVRDMPYARPVPIHIALVVRPLELYLLHRLPPLPAVVSISLPVYARYNLTYLSIIDWGDLTSHLSSIPPERSITQPAYDLTIDLPAELLALPSKDLATGVPILLKVDSAGHTSRSSCAPLYTNQSHSIRSVTSATQSYPSDGSLVTPTRAGSGTVQFSGHACTHTPSVLVIQLCLLCTISFFLRGV